MELRTISATFAVSPQITADDVAAIAAKGYRAIICNRPDGEGADQPSFEEIAQEIEKPFVDTIVEETNPVAEQPAPETGVGSDGEAHRDLAG